MSTWRNLWKRFLWSFFVNTGSYQTIRSLPGTWHSGAWPYAMHPTLMSHYQVSFLLRTGTYDRVWIVLQIPTGIHRTFEMLWNANKRRSFHQGPGHVPLSTRICSNVPRLAMFQTLNFENVSVLLCNLSMYMSFCVQVIFTRTMAFGSLSFLGVLVILAKSADGCNCPNWHHQEQFCRSDLGSIL